MLEQLAGQRVEVRGRTLEVASQRRARGGSAPDAAPKNGQDRGFMPPSVPEWDAQLHRRGPP
jgi:hypothetical protein